MADAHEAYMQSEPVRRNLSLAKKILDGIPDYIVDVMDFDLEDWDDDPDNEIVGQVELGEGEAFIHASFDFLQNHIEDAIESLKRDTNGVPFLIKSRLDDFDKATRGLDFIFGDDGKIRSFAHSMETKSGVYSIDKVVVSPEIYKKERSTDGTKLMMRLMHKFITESNTTACSVLPLNEHIGKYYERFGFAGTGRRGLLQISKEKAKESFNKYSRYFGMDIIKRHDKDFQELIDLENKVGILANNISPAPEITKQAVATGEPPDLSVAARMKARGLEWKRETHRWIRPEEIEEEEQKIHELSGNRDEFFDALMERFLDKKMSTEDLTEEQKIYLSDIKHSMDGKSDYLSSYVLNEAAVAYPMGNWSSVVANIRSSLDTKTYAQFRVSALDAVVDAGFKVDLDSSLNDDDLEEITKLVIRPYMISQLSELADKIQKTIEEIDFSTSEYTDSSPEGRRDKRNALDKFLSPINERIKEMSLVKYPLSRSPQELVDLYVDGVLDINGRYDRKTLNDSLIYSIENFIDREELDKVLQFSRDNLFKFVKADDRISVNNLVAKVYGASSPKAKEFMREALLNSLKDEELVSLIHMNFVSGGHEGSNETKDVLAGVNHLTLAIYEDMLKNGDIDDLVKFFSDENIPTGLLGQQEYSSLPFNFLSEHMSVDEFGLHVDTFLNSGEILRQVTIEALSFIDPNHSSLLAMIDTEENPYVISRLASSIPVTSLEDVANQANKIWHMIDAENLYQEAMNAYAKEHGIDDEVFVNPDDEGYDEYREKRGEQIAYAEKSVALMRHSRKDLEKSNLKAQTRLNLFQNVDLDIESVQSFHSILKNQPMTATTEQPYLPGMEPGDDEPMLGESGQSSFDEWANNFSDEFVDILEKAFSPFYDKPGLPELFDELYYGTLFGKMHTLSKGAWESSSSSAWAGTLKESVGRQFDDKVIFHSGSTFRVSIDEVLEIEKNKLFTPDKINSANFNQENLDKYVRIHKKLTRALLDKASPNSDTIEVFRGTSDNELSEEQYGTLSPDDFSSANIISNSLSSYSLNESTAVEHFATSDDSIIINIPELHKDNIWSTFFSHSYVGGEREILVINHSDMDAYAKGTQKEIDVDQFIPEYIGIDSIEYFYGTGESANEYVETYGNVAELVDYLVSSFERGRAVSDLQDYMDSAHYDSSLLSEWINDAAQQLMEHAKENYDYTYDIPEEQSMALQGIRNSGIASATYGGYEFIPDDILEDFDSVETLYDTLMKSEDFKNWVDKQELVFTGDDWEEYVQDFAERVYTWAEEGKEKVAGI